MSLLLLFHPQKATGGPTPADLASDGAGEALLTGAAVATADATFSGASDVTFGGASIATSDIIADGQAQTDLVGASIADAVIVAGAVATVEMEGASIGGTAAGDFDMAGVGELAFDGSAIAYAAVDVAATGALVVVGVAVEGEEEEIYRPAWIWGTGKIKRRRKKLEAQRRERLGAQRLEIEEDDEEVMALVKIAAAIADRQDALRALRKTPFAD